MEELNLRDQEKKHHKPEEQNVYNNIKIETNTSRAMSSSVQAILIGLFVVVIAAVVSFVIYDNIQSTTKEGSLHTPDTCKEQLQNLTKKLKEMDANLKTAQKELKREKEAHKQLAVSCEKLQYSHKWLEKLDIQFEKLVKSKEDTLDAKDETIYAFNLTVEAVKSELRVVKEQLTHIQTALIKIESEQTTDDIECTSVLCSGLKLIKSSVEAAIGRID